MRHAHHRHRARVVRARRALRAAIGEAPTGAMRAHFKLAAFCFWIVMPSVVRGPSSEAPHAASCARPLLRASGARARRDDTSLARACAARVSIMPPGA